MKILIGFCLQLNAGMEMKEDPTAFPEFTGPEGCCQPGESLTQQGAQQLCEVSPQLKIPGWPEGTGKCLVHCAYLCQ